MNKNEFLRILRENLNGLPADEAESAVRYYSEYIDDAGGSDAVFEELGDPAELAKKIRNDGQPKDGVEKEPASVAEKKSKMPIWAKILITVLTFPFWIGPVAAVFGVTVALVSGAAGFLFGGAARSAAEYISLSKMLRRGFSARVRGFCWSDSAVLSAWECFMSANMRV